MVVGPSPTSRPASAVPPDAALISSADSVTKTCPRASAGANAVRAAKVAVTKGAVAARITAKAATPQPKDGARAHSPKQPASTATWRVVSRSGSPASGNALSSSDTTRFPGPIAAISTAAVLGRTAYGLAEPVVDDDTLTEALALRKALFAVVERLLDAPDEPLPEAALEVVNAAAAQEAPVVALRADRTVARSGSWRAGLTAVARDGLALVDPGDGVLTWCADPSCTHPFLDRSRGHRRRWCEMAGCGDRAKAAAYRARRRAPA